MTLFKGLYQEFRRCNAQRQMLKNEAELAKEQLRAKVYQLLQLEKFQEKPEFKLESDTEIEANEMVDKLRKNLEKLTNDVSNLKQSIKDLDVISLIDENMKRQKETQFLQGNNEILLRQIEYLQKENRMLSANDSTDEGPNEKDLVIVQLEQEIQDLTEELSQISEDKLMLEKQLGY